MDRQDLRTTTVTQIGIVGGDIKAVAQCWAGEYTGRHHVNGFGPLSAILELPENE